MGQLRPRHSFSSRWSGVIAAAAVFTLVSAAPAQGGNAAAKPAPPPQTSGHHNLFLDARIGGKDVHFAYAVYLPKNYDAKSKPRPMVVFLMGAGECGDNHEGIYVHGPAAELNRDANLADWADFIVLSPQCPGGMRWDSPGLARAVLELTEIAKRTWRVDANRVYLTGLSMGGAGTWQVAIESGGGTFAAIAPISAVEVNPKGAVAALKGATAWVICGADDGDYAAGSRKMVKALQAGGVDVVPTEVPGRGHDVWASYYCSREFYEFLFLHQRGQPPPKSRPTAEQLLHIAYTSPQSVDARLAEPFKKFLPYWFLLNCGADMDPGLRERESLGGRSNVFVTHPLDASTPCRMITTLTIPKAQTTSLELLVASAPQGEWLLVVRANGAELVKKTVNPSAARAAPTTAPAATTRPVAATRPAGTTQPTAAGASGAATRPAGVEWMTVNVDLSSFAGQDVRVELLNAATKNPLSAAYWGQVQVSSRPATKKPAEGK